MSILPVEEISSNYVIDEASLNVEKMAQKTQSIWARAYDITIGNLVRLVHIVRRSIGGLVRDAFFSLKMVCDCKQYSYPKAVRN